MKASKLLSTWIGAILGALVGIMLIGAASYLSGQVAPPTPGAPYPPPPSVPVMFSLNSWLSPSVLMAVVTLLLGGLTFYIRSLNQSQSIDIGNRITAVEKAILEKMYERLDRMEEKFATREATQIEITAIKERLARAETKADERRGT